MQKLLILILLASAISAGCIAQAETVVTGQLISKHGCTGFPWSEPSVWQCVLDTGNLTLDYHEKQIDAIYIRTEGGDVPVCSKPKELEFNKTEHMRTIASAEPVGLTTEDLLKLKTTNGTATFTGQMIKTSICQTKPGKSMSGVNETNLDEYVFNCTPTECFEIHSFTL